MRYQGFALKKLTNKVERLRKKRAHIAVQNIYIFENRDELGIGEKKRRAGVLTVNLYTWHFMSGYRRRKNHPMGKISTLLIAVDLYLVLGSFLGS